MKNLSITGERSLDVRFDDAIRYFRDRGQVVFANESVHFWEPHGFVQQSLARLLTDHGIPVIWFDFFGWRSYQPTLWWNSPLLSVRSVFRLPGDRWAAVRKVNDARVATVLSKALLAKGKKPVFWVQASLSESIADKLPTVDIFSFFDDPYRHAIGDPLLEKARLITCQNQYAFQRLQPTYAHKTRLLFPPFQIPSTPATQKEKFQLPLAFPKKVMGYIGSFPAEGTDFGLIDYLLRHAVDWGILFVGRTDGAGFSEIHRWKQNPRFLHVPWVPPAELPKYWRAVDVTVLPYRNARVNDGAFPVKVLESLAYGIPVVATAVHKTSSLEGYIPRATFPDHFLKAVENQYLEGSSKTENLYQYFSREMDPKYHLIRVSEYLRSCE